MKKDAGAGKFLPRDVNPLCQRIKLYPVGANGDDFTRIGQMINKA